MNLRMNKSGDIYVIGIDGKPVYKWCYRDRDRPCGLDCMHFWESRDPKGDVDSVYFQCVPQPSPLVPIKVDRI